MALRKWNINAMYWSTNNTRSKHAQTLCGDTKCSGILSGSCEFSVTKILLRLTGTHMQVMRQRYRLQSHHLDSIFRCDHQQDREQGMCHCSATAGPALYFEYYERSVWSVFGGLIIDNKYIYMPSLIIKSSLKLKPLSAGPWKSMKWSSHKKCW